MTTVKYFVWMNFQLSDFSFFMFTRRRIVGAAFSDSLFGPFLSIFFEWEWPTTWQGSSYLAMDKPRAGDVL